LLNAAILAVLVVEPPHVRLRGEPGAVDAKFVSSALSGAADSSTSVFKSGSMSGRSMYRKTLL
jgi:hypothetical protein